MKKIFFIILLLYLLFIVGCTVNEADIKELNVCELDSDCQFIDFVGSCNTPEYVAQVMTKCQDKTGPCPSTPPGNPLNKNITCTCENHVCVTHR